jgi:hypothetical protein
VLGCRPGTSENSITHICFSHGQCPIDARTLVYQREVSEVEEGKEGWLTRTRGEKRGGMLKGDGKEIDDRETTLTHLPNLSHASRVISGCSGTSYGSSIPVNPLIFPSRASLYNPFESRCSHSSSGVCS